MRSGSQALWIAISGCILAGLGFAAVESARFLSPAPAQAPSAADEPSPPPVCEPSQGGRLTVPLEQPAQLGCDAARKVAGQARRHLVEAPARIDPHEFAETVNDWLDPHGLWSAAPDAPVAAMFEQHARRLLAALERGDVSGCESASVIGARLAEWVRALQAFYDEGVRTGSAGSGQPADVWKAASAPVFENGPVQTRARELALEFGRRSGTVQRAYGDELKPAFDRARARLFPELTPAQWGNAVLAAAVRAYVILVDPHGAWAPLDEETSLYEVELEASGRTRLWQKMSRTAAGLHIDEAAIGPLLDGDVVVSIAGIPTAGLSVEQAEQIGILDPNDESPDRDLIVLRQGKPAPVRLRVSPPEHGPGDEGAASVSATRVPFADGEAVVLKIADVPDDLGDEIASTLAEQQARGKPLGVVLDLRGNGGGSTDGARSAIGLFLPGVPLFPMKRRDGSIEIEHATKPVEVDRWDGAVATMVDGSTASAAEMIAGALAAYRRGPMVGSRTYGKGCAQEYMDDEVGAGVLRLTTLVYALPDGTPVQRVGLAPSFVLGPDPGGEREASFARSPGPWRAPDMRDRSAIRDIAWPSHGGHVGPCSEELACKTLRVLGAMRSASKRFGRGQER